MNRDMPKRSGSEVEASNADNVSGSPAINLPNFSDFEKEAIVGGAS